MFFDVCVRVELAHDFQAKHEAGLGPTSCQRKPRDGRGGCVQTQLKRQLNGDAVMTISTVPLEVRNGDRAPELIFNVYGKTYFLAQIWTGNSQGHELIKSKREKEVLRGVHRMEVALLLYPVAMAR